MFDTDSFEWYLALPISNSILTESHCITLKFNGYLLLVITPKTFVALPIPGQ